jgi:HD-GYP domain-containing protein (c-di-GMP phosphodiesterase class II)
MGADRGMVRAALLHDIGKLGLSNRILDKPGPLTSREWVAVRAHPLQTEEVLSRAGVLAPLAPVAGAHHERLDGSGYPRGLRAPALPTAARLIAVADVYDSMVSSRPYRVAIPADGALARMRDEAATGRLDAACVDALAAFVSRPGREAGAPTVV